MSVELPQLGVLGLPTLQKWSEIEGFGSGQSLPTTLSMQLQHKLHVAMGSIKDHASVGMALIYNRHAFLRDIEVAVVRATSHGGATAVDDKYVHQILFLVSNDPKCALFLADRLTCRLSKTRELLVALKTLVLVHRLLRAGNGWFEKRLRSAHGSGHLQIHLGTTHHFLNNNPSCLVISDFLQKYAAYVEKRMEWGINQAGKLEPAVSAGAPTPRIVDYPDAVLHKITKGQELLDNIILLDHSSAMSIIAADDQSRHALLLAALSNTLRESFEVYRTVWEGITFIVSEFFELTSRARAAAIEILRKASEQNSQISRFYGDCKRIIDGKSLDFPCVHVITMDHIAALEQLRFDSAKLMRHATATAASRRKEMDNASSAGGFGSLSSAPFSLTKETKVSKVWVVFDDQEEPEHQSP
ncbi:putative clathrin assembly protein At1g33340 isoform X2 [Ipomoea triloba]|nr:putative clathrin assembly protein At1g33340 isoform X2 [Ipomoea triloba]